MADSKMRWDVRDSLLGPPHEVKGDSLGPCPFCDREIAYAIGDDGEPKGVIHMMPMCDQFKAMEPDEFISAALEEAKRKLRS